MTKLSILGRLVFVILITQADDEGRQYADAHHIAKVFLGNGRLASGVGAQLKLMRSSRMVVTYLDASSRPVIALCNFRAQQKIDHPTVSRIQKPPEIRESSRARARSRESIAPTVSDRTVPEGIYPPVTPQQQEGVDNEGRRPLRLTVDRGTRRGGDMDRIGDLLVKT